MMSLPVTPRACAILGTAAVALVELAFSGPKTPILLWNATASAPIGLYLVTEAPIARGDLVVATPPGPVAQFAAKRRYLPLGVPLLKPIAAMTGDTICSTGHTITINGLVVAKRLDEDSHERPLPRWTGCRRLGQDSVFLLNAAVQTSFDGRYFGPVSSTSILGIARPIWTR